MRIFAPVPPEQRVRKPDAPVGASGFAGVSIKVFPDCGNKVPSARAGGHHQVEKVVQKTALGLYNYRIHHISGVSIMLIWNCCAGIYNQPSPAFLVFPYKFQQFALFSPLCAVLRRLCSSLFVCSWFRRGIVVKNQQGLFMEPFFRVFRGVQIVRRDVSNYK